MITAQTLVRFTINIESFLFVLFVIKFYYDLSDKSKLPCHIVGQTVLFESDSTKKSYIHAKTEHKMVEVRLIHIFPNTKKHKNIFIWYLNNWFKPLTHQTVFNMVNLIQLFKYFLTRAIFIRADWNNLLYKTLCGLDHLNF